MQNFQTTIEFGLVMLFVSLIVSIVAQLSAYKNLAIRLQEVERMLGVLIDLEVKQQNKNKPKSNMWE